MRSNLKILPIKIKNNRAKKKLYTINKSGVQKDSSKIDDIIIRGGAHTQTDFRQ